jgi:hypothetical protein
MLKMNRSIYNIGAGTILGNAACPSTNSLNIWARANHLNFGPLAAVPAGYNAKKGIVPALTGGAMASYKKAVISIDASANGALGRNIAAAATISILADAIGGLIAGGVATATISIDASASIVATISTTAAATISLDASGDLGAIGWLQGTSVITLDGAAEAYGIGHMVASTEDNSVLTPATIAAAVWESLSASFNNAGTMGAKLNAAASGGVDYSALADAVWAHADANTVETRLALLEKILRNKSITDPASGEFVLFDNDGTTELFRVPLWEDAAATQPYRGQGGERRERLA